MNNFDIKEYTDFVVDTYKQLKVYMCTSKAETTNSPIPIIQWMNNQGEVQVIGFDLEVPQLSLVVNSLREQLGTPSVVSFSSDAHFKTISQDPTSDASLENYERGQMRKDFENGDMTVKDALIIVVHTPTESCSSMVEYTYDDQGLPIFEEPTVTNKSQGLVSDSLVQAFVSLN